MGAVDRLARADVRDLPPVPRAAVLLMARTLPLFALVRHPDRPATGMLCKLAEDGTTYEQIAEGPWEKLVEEMDYLHEGVDSLHGPIK